MELMHDKCLLQAQAYNKFLVTITFIWKELDFGPLQPILLS